MDPRRKRKARLFVLLAVSVLLAAALIYTSIGAATTAKTPSELLKQADSGKSYELTGRVANGSVKRDGKLLRFRVRDRDGTASVPVAYTGTIPDPFREGREVIVAGTLRGGVFIGQRDSLVTKCPSKFKKARSE